MPDGGDAGTGPIGLLGGTFDPVHSGHLRLAIEALEALDLEHVRLLPLNLPGHREPPRASAAQRAAMLTAAAQWPLIVDLREIERGGTSYTVDTLCELRRALPRRPLVLLLGIDSFNTLPEWHRADELLELAHVAVAMRPDVGVPPVPGLDELIGNAQAENVDDLHHSPAGRVYYLDIPLLPIASSDLRARRRAGRDIRYLVPDAVHAYILENHLYAS